MSMLVTMMAHRKGNGNAFFPKAGQKCLFSGPHMDDAGGYTYVLVEVLWTDDTFIITRVPGCWPTVAKWEHIRCKEADNV